MTSGYGMVEVYCNHKSHAPKEAKVALFVRIGDSWSIQTGALGAPTARNISRIRRVHQRIEGSTPVPGTESTPHSDVSHDKYTLVCDLCGVDVQRHAEKAWVVLDKLDGAGVQRISLTGLAGVLGDAHKMM